MRGLEPVHLLLQPPPQLLARRVLVPGQEQALAAPRAVGASPPRAASASAATAAPRSRGERSGAEVRRGMLVVRHDLKVKVGHAEPLLLGEVVDGLAARAQVKVVQKLENHEADHHAALEDDAEAQPRLARERVVEPHHVGHHVHARERVREVAARAPARAHVVERLELLARDPQVVRPVFGHDGVGAARLPLDAEPLARVARSRDVKGDGSHPLAVQGQLVAQQRRAHAHRALQLKGAEPVLARALHERRVDLAGEKGVGQPANHAPFARVRPR